MSKYNEYAKRLDAAFKEAAEANNKALAAYQDANTAWDDEKDPLKKKVREAERDQAKKELQAAQRKAWDNFRSTKTAIGRELAQAVERAQLVDPDALDEKAIALLSSGILRSADLENMAEKYADNPTMLRMIGGRARDLADTEKDVDERRALNMLEHNCKNARPQILQNWDSLATMAAHYGGEYAPRADAALMQKLSDHWNDENVQAAIANF